MTPTTIDDPADPRIETFRDIRERDIVGRGGFIAEGAVVLDQLLDSQRFRPTALMVLENRLAGLLPRLARLPDDIPVYVASRSVFDAIAGFPVHRGILAHAEAVIPTGGAGDEAVNLARLAAQKATVVVAAGIANHDNMGAIFRNAAAFGAGAVLVDDASCDPLYRKAIRVSVGSVLTVPFARAGRAEAIHADLQSAGFRCLALSPKGQVALHELQCEGPAALFLGAEGPGLPQSIMDEMETLRIAMAPGLDSLNVATSAALVLHHLYSAASSGR
ncbi:TrmH family RNA methyltransferase [Mangrovicella endophytica]|uniref:TrmH family RNA methyltransferase n=1 Tax=Mangrovicella endophytica TaxID=2066697 RepID=UPI000C9E5A10|nr:RNA methyltransferase [Mangrovicella endophytica]